MPGVPTFPAFPDNIEVQHTIMNDMQKSLMKNKDYQGTFEGIVKVYTEFRNKHVLYEEQYMREHNYPNIERHKLEHVKIKELEDSILKFGIDKDTLDYSIRIWKLHIITEDKEMINWISKSDDGFSITNNGI